MKIPNNKAKVFKVFKYLKDSLLLIISTPTKKPIKIITTCTGDRFLKVLSSVSPQVYNKFKKGSQMGQTKRRVEGCDGTFKMKPS